MQVGDEILCDLMDEAEAGSEVRFEQVLLVGEEGSVKVGRPLLAGAVVRGEVVGPARGKKLIVFHFKRRKNIHRKNGHRQDYTRVRITAIES